MTRTPTIATQQRCGWASDLWPVDQESVALPLVPPHHLHSCTVLFNCPLRIVHPVHIKRCHFESVKTLSNLFGFPHFSPLEGVWNLQYFFSPTLCMLLHYLGKSEIHIRCKSESKCKQHALILHAFRLLTYLLLTYLLLAENCGIKMTFFSFFAPQWQTSAPIEVRFGMV